jgi:hypothetical protein
MKRFHTVARAAVLTLTVSGVFAVTLFAQNPDDSNRRDRVKTETTMTGCLNKGTSGNYTLTDEKTGVKTTVAGPSDLEKHSANHKVSLTGTSTTDAHGNQVFEVSKIQHISGSCTAPSK